MNWLSLDVSAGAFLLSASLTHLLGFKANWKELLSLSLAVWIIYTLDHLLDIRGRVRSPRRSFHHRYARYLVAGVLVCLAIGCWLMFELPREILISGTTLGVLCFLYLVIQQLSIFRIWKELFVALLYASGVGIIPLYHAGLSIRSIVLILVLFSIAFLNLLIFSWFERAEDRRDKTIGSFASLPEAAVKRILIWLFLASLVLHTCLAIAGASSTLVMLMALLLVIHFLVWSFPSWSGKYNRYRLLGDWSFALSGLLLLV